jgi:hypothetical protein
MWHVWEEKKYTYWLLVGKSKEKGDLEDLDIVERVIPIPVARTRTGLIWPRE